MASCLGLYIESNLIKYAKISKDKNTKKVESFGIKFYDKVEEGIKQIIEETYSYKIPVCINLSEEMYQYFPMFAMLSKKDLDKAIKTEFESYCSDKGYNPNVFETRYAVVNEKEDDQKLKVIFVTDNKIELNKQMQLLQNYKLTGLYPLPMSIPNLLDLEEASGNCLIVNMEEKTTITTIIDKKIYNVKTLEQGSGEFLDKINLKENSYQKAYEMCKETTIYTSEGRELTEQQAGYLEEIMPTLYQIVGQIQKTINESFEKIEKIYITGTAALINNIDLYFEEYLENVKCEILKPGFIRISPEINIKDYVEVNSAISLAISGLGEGITGINFKKASFSDRLPDFLKIEIGPSKKDKTKSSKPNPLEKLLKSSAFTMDFNVPLDKVEKGMLRTATGLLILFFVYSGFSIMIKNQIDNKMDEANKSIANTNSQMQLIDNDKSKLQTKTTEYTTKISNLQKVNDKINDINKTKKAIPNLLNKLMYIMPTGVQITSIQNTSATHIEIQAQSNKYEQLGFLVTNMQLEPVLTNVISTAGQKANGIITIKIEGDLP